MKPSSILKGYGVLFLLAGAAFLFFPGLCMAVLSLGADWLPGARPLPDAGRTLWLGLAGSMMAMISYLAFALAADPRQQTAWRALLLSKAVSTGLFLLFVLADKNALFLVAAAVDGAILIHLAGLSLAFADLADPWSSRIAGLPDCLHEAWFLKANDPATRDAFWLRYTLERTDRGIEGGLWYAVFDVKERRVLSGRWSPPQAAAHSSPMHENPSEGPSAHAVCGFADADLTRTSAMARSPDVDWRLSWRRAAIPPFSFVPTWLYLWGAAGTVYVAPAPAARFDGEIRVEGRTYRFAGAPGSVGHLWGRRKGEAWRWAHAVFQREDGAVEAVFEILSARGRLGPLVLPRVTSAHLWHDGRHHATAWPGAFGGNRTWARDRGWGFRFESRDLSAEGDCAPDEGMTAELEYGDQDGRVLRCRNSTVGALRLRLSRADGGAEAAFETPDGAAVETVGRLR
ncbi:MAG: hypothetical protein HY748_05250 [Elusimicrobia bacterium]|nr:hypothetical protein [Elusimicrobiota bacterium]